MNDTQGATSPQIEIPSEAIGYYEDWADGLMIEVEAVHVKDIPAIVAAELERLARTIAVTAPLGDLIATAEAAARRQVRDTLLDRVDALRKADA